MDLPLVWPRQPRDRFVLLLRELWGSSMSDADRIQQVIDDNDKRIHTAERLSVAALCEIARQLARLADLYEFELGLEEEDLEELSQELSTEDLDEINKLPPAEG